MVSAFLNSKDGEINNNCDTEGEKEGQVGQATSRCDILENRQSSEIALSAGFHLLPAKTAQKIPEIYNGKYVI